MDKALGSVRSLLPDKLQDRVSVLPVIEVAVPVQLATGLWFCFLERTESSQDGRGPAAFPYLTGSDRRLYINVC